MMKWILNLGVVLAASMVVVSNSCVDAFTAVPQQSLLQRSSTSLRMALDEPTKAQQERMKKIMQEEAMNPETMKQSMEMMKNLKPDDIDKMIAEMDRMPAFQRKQMEEMGMNAEVMKQSMEMMKSNPAMTTKISEMMDTLTPEQLLERSMQAQQTLGGMGAAAADGTASPSTTVDATSTDANENDDDDTDDIISLPDSKILDTLFDVGVIMSNTNDGTMTLDGLVCTPPISLLVGTDSERDLSMSELLECWNEVVGDSAKMVDRQQFNALWTELQEYFSLPMLNKAIQRTGASAASKNSKAAATTSPAPSITIPSTEINTTQFQEQIKNMSPSDMDVMLARLNDIGPAEEAQMKAQGINPTMMKQMAKLMKSNPSIKTMVQKQIKSMTPEQMVTASKQAKSQLKDISSTEYDTLLNNIASSADDKK